MKSFFPGSLFQLAILFCFATAITSPAQVLTTLASFDQTNGAMPWAPLIQASDGNFYGTTAYGGVRGPIGNGTIFKITPGGTLTSIYSFCNQDDCGGIPYAGLLQATDGNFYGTTAAGGIAGNGTVFKLTPSGSLSTLYLFCSQPDCTDGGGPFAGLAQGTDGNFYGTAISGGANSAGTVFQITPTGSLTTLYSFCSQSNCTDGSQPRAALVQATDGNFYGTTSNNGANNGGTVFKITPSGTLTTLYSFCSQPHCADGASPEAALMQATDGNLYGTTTGFGANNGGTVFKITTTGTQTTLYSFNAPSDGSASVATLVQASDGNFYGTTSFSGPHGAGTAFKLTPGGNFTNLYSFCSEPNCTDGAYPLAGLVVGTNGNFYGTTQEGGTNGPYGTVFSLSGPNPTPFQLIPVTPCRVVDTRNPDGEFGGPPIQGNTYRSFPLPQNSNCSIPATAAAYSLNVTVVPHEPLNYLTIWPTGENQRFVSTMNSPDGRVKANAAIVPAGANEAVSVYVTNTTDVILDIDGYFTAPGSQTYEFYPVTPCRVVDTRSGSNEPQGLGPPSLRARQQRDLPILSSPCLQGITNPLAYSFNVTVVPNPAGQPLSYLTVWPSNQMQPTVSTLNNPTATVVANAAIVPAAPDGDIDVYAYNSTDLIIDINGYFAAPGQNGLSLYPVAPCRVLDTRNGNGQPFMGRKVVNVVASPCAPPSNAQAYLFNATVVPPGQMPYLTLWPDGQPQPAVSTLNAYDGFITSNMAIVPTTNGSIDAYAAGLTQLILDISGYFAP